MLGPIFFGDEIKEGEMGVACRMHGGEDKYVGDSIIIRARDTNFISIKTL